MPINFRLTPPEALALVEHSSAKTMFISKRLENELKDSYGDFQAALDHGILTVNDDASSPDGYEQLISRQPETNPDLNVSENDLFALATHQELLVYQRVQKYLTAPGRYSC